MTAPFQPKSETGTAQWEIIYGYLQGLPYGHVATYDDVLTATDIDLRVNRQPIYRAMKELEANDQKTLESVHKVGYKVAEPKEHETLARRHHKSARRQVDKAVRKARSANRALLNPTERAQIDAVEMTLSRHADAIRRLDGRVSKIETAQSEARQETEEKFGDLSEQVERMREALKRKGIDPDSKS